MGKINKSKSMQLLKENRDTIVIVGRAVFTAMAFVETIRPVVEGYQREILNMMQAHIAPKNIIRGRQDEIILDPENTYLMKEDDFAEYIDECHIAAQKHGFNVQEKGHCPLLIAKNNLRKARQLLIETMEPITGIKLDDLFHHGLTDYENYIELTLKMIASMASEKELNVLHK
jgi:hypothetical protein